MNEHLLQLLRDAEARADAFRDAWISIRQDAPNVGLFNNWLDATAEAHRLAALTGRRYRVTFEPNNRWWQIHERGRLDWWHEMGAER